MNVLEAPWPLIGVVHLPPLPGYPDCPGMKALVAHALSDLEALEGAGFHGILLENENDRPYRVLSEPEITAAMTEIVGRTVERARRVIVGVEILLNDPRASLAVANASGAGFIRTDYFVDRMARDEHGGEMQIDPEGLISYRKKLGAEEVAVFADLQVKYARMLEEKTIARSATEAREKGADGVIITGMLTGSAPVLQDIEAARAAIQGHPVLIGSGFAASNARALVARATGAIVGTGIMTNGVIDRDRAKALSREVERCVRLPR